MQIPSVQITHSSVAGSVPDAADLEIGALAVNVADAAIYTKDYTGTVKRITADIAATTHAATSKTTPVDADELPIVDSAASNMLKKLTWANLKATLASWIGGNLIAASFTTLTTSSTITTAEKVLTSGVYVILGKSTNNSLRVYPQTDANGVELAATDSSGVVAFKPMTIKANGLTLTDSSGTGKVVINSTTVAVTGALTTTGSTTITGGFGCNGVAAQGLYTLGGAATDLATVITLANNLRALCRNNGLAN